MKRTTPQRRAIAEVLAHADGPLTPQAIRERASARLPSLGLATVYRNLTVLSEAGEVRAVELPGETTRFESSTRGHHHHFQCRSCREVFELPTECPVRAFEGVTLPGGFHVEDHHLTFYGTCPACSA